LLRSLSLAFLFDSPGFIVLRDATKVKRDLLMLCPLPILVCLFCHRGREF